MHEYMDMTELPIQLDDTGTLIGVGAKMHGLLGEDADRWECGQVWITEAWAFADHAYAKFDGIATIELPTDYPDDLVGTPYWVDGFECDGRAEVYLNTGPIDVTVPTPDADLDTDEKVVEVMVPLLVEAIQQCEEIVEFQNYLVTIHDKLHGFGG